MAKLSIDIILTLKLLVGASLYILRALYVGLGSKLARLRLLGMTRNIPLRIMFDRPARWNPNARGLKLGKAQVQMFFAFKSPLPLLNYLLEATQP